MNDEARQSELYAGIWSKDASYGTKQTDVCDTVLHRIMPHMRRLFSRPASVQVVDFGAGDGRFLQTLWSYGGLNFGIGIDVYEPSYLPLWMGWRKQSMWLDPGISGDYVISTDALEHLPPDKVRPTLIWIRNVANHGFLRVSLIEDKYGTERGLHLHESVFPADDWLTMIADANINVTSYRTYITDGTPTALEVWF